ncbi:MAG: hypothetical protein Q4D56_05930 [Bacteroides sp.]|nr:hypothetical protein [Bacteroides sp.]
MNIRFWGIVCIGFFFSLVSVAQVNQRGKVTLQNSGGQPLSGVQILASGAVPAISDVQGTFSLRFNKSRAGEMLLLDSVYKKGYELVNERALQQWSVSSSRQLPIVMCPEGTLVAAQEKYYEIGKSHNMKRYANACRELDKQLAAKCITQDEYNKQLDQVSGEFQRTMEKLEAYAYNMACYNRDDLNQMSIQALSLVEAGQVGQALSLYASQQLAEHYRGLGGKEELTVREQEAMLASMRLNADICLFAGGDENIHRADEIYQAIALSDTTNASYALEYATFLSDHLVDMGRCVEWLHCALRHSTNGLQRAEIYSGLAMATTYMDRLDETADYLKRSDAYYQKLLGDSIYREDAYFNMSYVTYLINEGRYWGKMRNDKAVDRLSLGINYANKAIAIQPQKYAYHYAFYLMDFAMHFQDLMIRYNIRTNEMRQTTLDICNIGLSCLKLVDEKERLKAAVIESGFYLTMSTVNLNCSNLGQAILYNDSCQATVERFMHLNPVLFTPIKIKSMAMYGSVLLSQNKFREAFTHLNSVYGQMRELPYVRKALGQILSQMSQCVMTFDLEKDIDQMLAVTHESLDFVYQYPDVLLGRQEMEVQYAYLHVRAYGKKELPNYEQALLRMIDFVLSNDIRGEWFTYEHMRLLVAGVFDLYNKKQVTTLENKRKVLIGMYKLIERYSQLKDSASYKLLMQKIWNECAD